MARKKKENRFGHLPPQHHFSLNPYPGMRFNKCPICENKTGQRKLPLIIHINPMEMIALNYTNRYCKVCDRLIGHKHEIEHYLTVMFLQRDPNVVGNDYLIFGTLEKQSWRQHLSQSEPLDEMRKFMHDFKSYEELRMTRGGWFREDEEPPIMEPPPSEEWVKPKRSGAVAKKKTRIWNKGFG